MLQDRNMENGTLMWAQDRDHAKKPLTNTYKYFAFLCVLSLSPAPLTSLLPQIQGPVDCRHSATLQVAALIEKHLLFPAISYLLLTSAGNHSPEVTKCVSHQHTLFCWESCFTGTPPNPPQKKNSRLVYNVNWVV